MKRKLLPTVFGGKPSLFQTLQSLGLTNGLQFCLDAGDPASYPGNGQSWLDRSGNGQDFFLGADGSATSTDPTFVPLGRNSYFSFDGGDYFTYDTTNETWMNAMHKDNAAWTIVVWYYPATLGSAQAIFATNAQGSLGIDITNQSAGGALRVQVANDSGNALVGGITGPLVVNAWNFVGISQDETSATGLISLINDVSAAGDGRYTTPSSSDAGATAQIGCAAGGAILSSGSRIAAFAAWSTPLTAANLSAIRSATRGRFRV